MPLFCLFAFTKSTSDDAAAKQKVGETMTDFIFLQNYARNLLMRYFLGCAGVLDVEPGVKGSREMLRKGGSGKAFGQGVAGGPPLEGGGRADAGGVLAGLRDGLADRRP